MALDEVMITRAIIERYTEKLLENLDIDVAIVGAGPSGLVAAYHLAKSGRKVAVFERKLSIGGGMWGGGMMFNEIVVQEEALHVLKSFGVNARFYKENYFTADAIECVSTLTSKAVQAGATIFNLISVEDVVIRKDRAAGLVINWSPVELQGLHVDPLTIRSRFIIDATGHPVELLSIIEKKGNAPLLTNSGRVEGERSLWAEPAETSTVSNTKEAFPGVYVCGMAANATFGAYRMGPVFGGMLLSGVKVAETLHRKLAEDMEPDAPDVP